MRRVRLVTLLFFAFATRRAHATEPAPALKGEAPLPLELEWKAPPECPKADDIHAELSRIARVRPGRVPPTVVARVRIDKRSGRYHLVLKTTRDGEVGKRNLSAAECGALGREVTLVLALTFGDGVALASEGEDEPPTADAGNSSAPVETKPEAPPKPLPVAPPSARAEAASPPAAPVTSLERTPRVAAFAGGGVLLRALPRLAARISLGAEVGSRKFWLAPELSVVLPSHDSLARGVSARYDAAGGALAGCSALAESPRVAACITASALAVRGRSSGASISRAAVAPWYSAGAQLSVAWPTRTKLAVRLDGALLASLNAPRFTVDGLGEAHTIPRVTAVLSASVLLRL